MYIIILTEKDKVNVSKPIHGKTKGTTTFLPTVEQGSQITFPIHPLS